MPEWVFVGSFSTVLLLAEIHKDARTGLTLRRLTMPETTLPADLLKRFNHIGTFIETGTARGEGTQQALDCGMRKIITVEANPDVFVKASKRFIGEDCVTCILGDSGDVLKDVLTDLAEPAVFWLDSHFSTGDEELEDVSKCPILLDLRAISDHPIKNHVILIDDIRYFATGLPMWGGIMLGDIMSMILEINPEYKIDFADGHVPNDILVAEVK